MCVILLLVKARIKTIIFKVYTSYLHKICLKNLNIVHIFFFFNGAESQNLLIYNSVLILCHNTSRILNKWFILLTNRSY